jgi:hypothetical protein
MILPDTGFWNKLLENTPRRGKTGIPFEYSLLISRKRLKKYGCKIL